MNTKCKSLSYICNEYLNKYYAIPELNAEQIDLAHIYWDGENLEIRQLNLVSEVCIAHCWYEV